MTIEMTESTCPTCSKIRDAAAGFSSPTPEPGDVSVCFYCGGLSIFLEDMTVRLPTDEELRQIMRGQHGEMIQRAQAAIRKRVGGTDG